MTAPPRRGHLAGDRAVADLRADHRERRGRAAARPRRGRRPCHRARSAARPDQSLRAGPHQAGDGRPGRFGAGARPVALTATLPGGGALDVQGTARSTPLGSTLRARISRVDLAFWAPYLDLPLQFNGMIETDLTVDVTGPAAGAAGGVTTRVRGRATLNDATVFGPRGIDAPTPDTASAGGAPADRMREGRRRLSGRAHGADRARRAVAKVRIERLRLARPRVTIERDRTGHFPIVDVVQALRPGRRPRRRPPRRQAAGNDHRRARARDRRGRGRAGPGPLRRCHGRADRAPADRADRAHRERRHLAGAPARPGQAHRRHARGRHGRCRGHRRARPRPLRAPRARHRRRARAVPRLRAPERAPAGPARGGPDAQGPARRADAAQRPRHHRARRRLLLRR